MGRSPNFAISSWHRLRHSGDYWVERAQCRTCPSLPWVADSTPTLPEQAEMEAVCDTCPVRARCAQHAIDTSSGGFYAGIWVPWHTESRSSKEVRKYAFSLLRKVVRAHHRESVTSC